MLLWCTMYDFIYCNDRSPYTWVWTTKPPPSTVPGKQTSGLPEISSTAISPPQDSRMIIIPLSICLPVLTVLAILGSLFLVKKLRSRSDDPTTNDLEMEPLVGQSGQSQNPQVWPFCILRPILLSNFMLYGFIAPSASCWSLTMPSWSFLAPLSFSSPIFQLLDHIWGRGGGKRAICYTLDRFGWNGEEEDYKSFRQTFRQLYTNVSWVLVCFSIISISVSFSFNRFCVFSSPSVY